MFGRFADAQDVVGLGPCPAGDADFAVETYPTGELCIESLANGPDIIILDYHLDGITEGAMNGMETLKKIKALHPDIPVIMLSSQDKIEIAITESGAGRALGLLGHGAGQARAVAGPGIRGSQQSRP